MLKQKRSLTKLREELEGRRGKLYQCCKRFGHLAYNCRSKKEEKKGATVRATGMENSRRFLRELDEAPGGNNLHYILQCLHVPASVTRV